MNRFLLLFFAVILFGSCEKTREGQMLRGIFVLDEAFLNDETNNFMEVVLDRYNYEPNCCKYYINFEDDSLCTGSYYINDSLQYMVTGEWDLIDRHTMYINLDDYVNGIFNIDDNGFYKFQMTTDENVGTIQDGAITIRTAMTMNITKL